MTLDLDYDNEPRTSEQKRRLRSIAVSLGYAKADVDELVRVARTRGKADELIRSLRRLWVRRRRAA